MVSTVYISMVYTVGVVVANDKQMQCQCNETYIGYHCEDCNFGFYKNGNYCVPCNCFGNENKDVKDFCDGKTGIVMINRCCND